MEHGCIGCTLSHILCIETAQKNNWSEVCIVEDDAVFKNPKLLVENLEKFHKDNPNWDVLLLGGNVVQPFDKINDYCIRSYNTQTTTCYIVKKHYYQKLIDNFKQSVENLIREPTNKNDYALDMYWKRLQRTDNWFMIIPLTITQLPGYSDIENRIVNYDVLMLDLEKKWLYKNPNIIR
jgi:GR25 family glycosyltransferase involved in LPS biosynthesis